jgi:hypothetical protein
MLNRRRNRSRRAEEAFVMSGRARIARPRRCGIAAALLIATPWLAGCGAPRSLAPRVAFTREHAEQHYGDCASAAGCTRIRLRWPGITSAPTEAAKESLSTFIRQTLLRPYEGGTPLSSTDSVMGQFIEAYHASAAEFPEGGSIPWRFERRIEVLGDTLGVLSLATSESAFTGGVHPNSSVRFTNFDTRSGRVLRRDDLLSPQGRDSVDALGERAFRRVLRLPPGQDLGASGYMFEGGRFRLNENMAVTRNGLLFYFNDYEIGSHALGATELTLRWKDVKPYVRPDGPLGRPARP